MVKLTVTLTLKEPLLVGNVYPSPTEQVQSTMRYIPGAVLRGAVGTRLVKLGNHAHHQNERVADCPFCRIFLTGNPPRFGPGYPVGHTASESRPLPATARTCKYYSGFKAEEDNHGIRDILFRQWAVESAFDHTHDLSPTYPFRCHVAECEADLQPAGKGFYEHVDFNFFQPQVWVQRFSRVGIDRRRHVAADELLYTLEVLAEQMDSGRRRNGQVSKNPTTFKSYVWVEAEAELLAEALRKVDRLGGDTARGLGAVTIHVELPRSPVSNTITPAEIQSLAAAVDNGTFETIAGKKENTLVTRLTRFNTKLREVAGQVGSPVPAGALFFSVDLLSDVIWTENGLPAASLPETLANANRIRSWTTAHTHGGWHTAAKIMRRTELAIEAGSVFLYQLDKANNVSVLTETLTVLAQLEREGLGQERERGYGWIEICSPFHLEVEPK